MWDELHGRCHGMGVDPDRKRRRRLVDVEDAVGAEEEDTPERPRHGEDGEAVGWERVLRATHCC